MVQPVMLNVDPDSVSFIPWETSRIRTHMLFSKVTSVNCYFLSLVLSGPFRILNTIKVKGTLGSRKTFM